MNPKLIENNYLVIKNFISTYRSNLLKEEFVEYTKEKNIKGDNQAPNSHSIYNYISFLELLCEKTPEVSSILEETVLPCYSYARVYKKGSILKSHTDRDACEISLTLHLGSDSEWKFWIKNPKGEDCCVTLNPGDAILYLGCESEHWREEYLGEEYVQVFLHYVRSRGDKMYAYFDNSIENKKRHEHSNYNKNCQNIELEHNNNLETNEECDNENGDKENLNEKDIFDYHKISDTKSNLQDKISTISEIKENKQEITICNYKKPILINSQLKLENFIQVFDDVMPEYVCDNIIEEYRNCDEWSKSSTGSGINPGVRSSDCIGISMRSSIEKNLDKRAEIDNIVYNVTNNCLKLYKRVHETLDIDVDTGYDLLRYEQGQYYIQHVDSFNKQQRSISCSINLNDDYDGGEFAFFNREIIIKAKKGSAIVFPSNFMYPHEIIPVTKGTRYSIVTWFI